MGGGERVQPPRKRLKASRTLFDFGIKRGHEASPEKGSLLEQLETSSGHHEVKTCSEAGRPVANEQTEKRDTSGAENGGAVDAGVEQEQGAALVLVTRDEATREQGCQEVPASPPSLAWQQASLQAFKQQAAPDLSGHDLPAPRLHLENSMRRERASPKRSTSFWPLGVKENVQSPPRPFKPDPQKVPGVPGLQYSIDFLSKQEERYIISLLDSGRFMWRRDIARRTLHFGHNYVYSKRPKEKGAAAPPIPPELAFITDRMVAAGVYTPAEAPTVLIVNEYIEDQGIAAHVDKFEFSNTVVSISLNSGCWMRFHELDLAPGILPVSIKNNAAPRTGRVEEMWLEPRSILVLQDDARIRWQHEIPKNKKGRPSVGFRRLSLTYRTRQRIGPDKSGRA